MNTNVTDVTCILNELSDSVAKIDDSEIKTSNNPVSELLPAHWLEDKDDYIKCYCQWYLALNSLRILSRDLICSRERFEQLP